jgi:hypothetical protein
MPYRASILVVCPRLEVDLTGEDEPASSLSKMAIPNPDVLHIAVGLTYPGVRDGHGHGRC